jgi:hypothetical protein
MEPTGWALRYDATDTLDAIGECYRRGWTGGLPIVPPVADKVADMLAAAANAVMDGCLPFPVVLAAIEAFFEHDPNIPHEISAATNAPGWLILVNGFLRRRLGLGCSDNILGSANRANATIGRAVASVTYPNPLDSVFHSTFRKVHSGYRDRMLASTRLR